MASLSLIDFKGIVTAPGLLLRAEASCVSAMNALLDAPGLMRKRAGFERFANRPGAGVLQLHTSPLLNDAFLAHIGSTATANTMSVGTGAGVFTGLSTVDSSLVTRNAPYKQRMGVLGRSHYLTSDEGLRRIDGIAGPVRFAGMPKGLGPSQESGVFTVLTATTPTWLANGASVAYRVTWHRVVDTIELGGAPTGRAIVRNLAGTVGHTGGARSVSIRVPVPREFGTLSTALTTSYFFRLWRSRAATVDPDDELYLVAEQALVAGDITAGYATVNDLTPDSVLTGNARLHTNPRNFPDGEVNAAQGQLNADNPPPSSNDVATWRERLWVADFADRSAYTAQLLSVGGSGFVAGDTISLDGVNTMTATAGAPGANQFTIVTALSTLALNIEATARNIVDRHNSLYACLGTSPVFAYYVSQGTQAPGLIFVEAKQQSGGASPATSRTAAWRLPSSASFAQLPNRIRYSKEGRADAMAPVNELQAGPQMGTILRIIPYRDRLLVFSDTGIYQVTGSSYADFAVSPFDLTYRLAGRSLVAVCDDRVYAWCLEGIIEVDEGGARVVSAPIEPTVLLAAATAQTSLNSYGFAVAYREQHRVLFFYPPDSSSGALGCNAGLVWDTRTRGWTTIAFNTADDGDDVMKSCGVVRHSDDRLVLGWWNPAGGDGVVFLEKRAFSSGDYADQDALGVTQAIQYDVSFQFQVPIISGAVHWQTTVLQFEGGEFVWKSRPTGLTVFYSTEWVSNVSVAILPVSNICRVEPNVQVRRGNQFRVRLQHTAVESCGLIGIEQVFEPATRFARRT